MEKIMKIWVFLSGKKTVTAAILKAAADVLTVAGQVEAAAIVDQIGNALLALGLTHKVAKKV
jgi:hypothetical protein